ncbi:MAG TPA: hypothetical protein VM370_12280 [Candidatus Thermoplasmatota archaeon]|nr:hypothetical protein [Candidatus Thermoplasmatota archaeon]
MRASVLVDAMTIIGKLANTRGCCPVCGNDVQLRQSFNGVRFLQSYGCYRCGPTQYVVSA